MRRPSRFAWLGCALFLTVPACGDDGSSSGDDAPDVDANPDDQPDADNAGFTEIIGRDWTIPAGSEVYKCVGIRAETDMYISAFRTPNPTGEHHAVLTVDDNPGGFGGTELGVYDCDVGRLGTGMVFASGVGTDDLVMPDGVALKVEAGKFVHLNLHLFNSHPTDSISAYSSILVKTVPPVDPSMEAEMIFAGTFEVNVPPMQTATASGGCTFQNDATIFAYWPHMHQAANHHKVTMTIGGEAMVLHDQPFDFGEQLNFPLSPPLQVSSGDSINVECTYYNPSATDPIEWGDSSNEEMCFTGLYRYPKQAGVLGLFDCTSGGLPPF